MKAQEGGTVEGILEGGWRPRKSNAEFCRVILSGIVTLDAKYNSLFGLLSLAETGKLVQTAVQKTFL